MQAMTKTSSTSSQFKTSGHVAKISSDEIKTRLENLCNLGAEALGTNLRSTEETQAWHHFILDLALQSLAQQSDTPCTFLMTNVLSGVSLSSTGQGASIEIKMNGKITIMSDVSLDKLLEKIRIVIAGQDEDYFGADHIQLVKSVKQRVAFDDIVHGLTCGIGNLTLPGARLGLFRNHCLFIQKEFLLFFTQNQKTNSIRVNFGDWQITLTWAKPNLRLAIGDHEVTLKDTTWEKLLIALCQQNSHPPLDMFMQEHCYRRLDWYGALYNKTQGWISAISENNSHKGQPYRTIKVTNVFPVNLNGEISFATRTADNTPGEQIECRHLVFHFIKDCLEDKQRQGKIDWTPYSTPESIKTHIAMETDDAYHALKANAKRYDLIHNDTIGEYIQGCFEEMRCSHNGETVRLLLISSAAHAMAIRLRIKNKDTSGSVFVVSFYDPNTTNSAMRCATRDLLIFKRHTLKYYIDGSSTDQADSRYDLYYGKNAPISMVMECDLKGVQASIACRITQIERKLASIPSGPLTPTHLFFFLRDNVFPDSVQLQSQIKDIAGIEIEEWLNLLAAKPKGIPGLFMALQNGHAEAIQMYGELLKLIPDLENKQNALIDLLSVKNENGTPGLFMALQDGRPEAIEMYGGLLKLIPKNEQGQATLTDLLAAKDPMKTPGLFIALEGGHAKAIEKYGSLLKLIPENKWIDLLDTKDATGSPGLFRALQGGHAEAIEEYGKLLKPIPNNKRIDLLVTKDANGVRGLLIALQHGHAKAIEKYDALLQPISNSEQGQATLIGLLSVKTERGVPGLCMALKNGHAEAIQMYGKLLQRIPEEKQQATLIELLTVKCAQGSVALSLFMALQEGHAEAIEKFGKLLELIPKNKRNALIDLLGAKNSKDRPGLFMALQDGHAEAIEKYGKLLELIPEGKQDALIDLLRAKAENGVSGLFIALNNGRAKAIQMYGKLLQLIPKNQQNVLIDLLSAKNGNMPWLFTALCGGHAEAIQVYGELLKFLLGNEQDTLMDLLAAKHANGTPGLFMALQEGRADAIEMYGKLLKPISKAKQADLIVLLGAKSTKGTPGLCMALKNGHAKAIQMYGNLLKLIPEDEQAALIQFITNKQGPALFMALQDGHADAIQMYGELLKLIPQNKRKALINFLAAKNKDTPGLFMALKNNRAEAVKAYRELQLLFTPEERHLLYKQLEYKQPEFTVPEQTDISTAMAHSKLTILVTDWNSSDQTEK